MRFLFCRYLAELLAERQKLAPFMQVLPFCNRLLNQGLFPLPFWIFSVYLSIPICLYSLNVSAYQGSASNHLLLLSILLSCYSVDLG
jgi:hypothetical protein